MSTGKNTGTAPAEAPKENVNHSVYGLSGGGDVARVTLFGVVDREPMMVGAINSDKVYAIMTVTCYQRHKDHDGEYRYNAINIPVRVTKEIKTVCAVLTKGTRVAILGEIMSHRRKIDGEWHNILSVKAQRIEICGRPLRQYLGTVSPPQEYIE